jgi:hypothetical protein
MPDDDKLDALRKAFEAHSTEEQIQDHAFQTGLRADLQVLTHRVQQTERDVATLAVEVQGARAEATLTHLAVDVFATEFRARMQSVSGHISDFGKRLDSGESQDRKIISDVSHLKVDKAADSGKRSGALWVVKATAVVVGAIVGAVSTLWTAFHVLAPLLKP